MTQEALKLALEFIERVNKDGWILADFEPEMYATITAIKEALAQPEQEPEDATLRFADGKMFAVGQPFYTHPPQRTWVGLTDEEINKLRYKKDWTAPWTDMTFARAIEAKLKEKNT